MQQLLRRGMCGNVPVVTLSQLFPDTIFLLRLSLPLNLT